MIKLFKDREKKRLALTEVDKKIAEEFQEKFGCEITFGEALATVKNDLFRYNIWFMSEVTKIEPNGCNETPKDEEEAVEVFRGMRAMKNSITESREYLIKLLDMRERH